MAARTPPLPPQPPPRSGGVMLLERAVTRTEEETSEIGETTTLSTIVVRAGQDANLVVALLRSAGYLELRIDEMNPPLLSVGETSQQSERLLRIHDELMRRISEKEQQVDQMLARAAALPGEKDPREARVYAAMAVSLESAWQQLLRRLALRGELLRQVHEFHTLAEHHEQLTRATCSGLSSLSTSKSADTLTKHISSSINEIVDTTARAMDLGANAMAQLRVLGELSDNDKRASEILDGSLSIENAMLKMASEWENVERTWNEFKTTETVQAVQQRTVEEVVDESSTEVLEEISHWLGHAQKRAKAANDYGLQTILQESETQRTRLVRVATESSQKGDSSTRDRAGELIASVDALTQTIHNKIESSNRIRGFFVSAQSVWQQLQSMEHDIATATESMAGELAPLARQKANALADHAQQILEKEHLTYEERRQVQRRTEEILEKAGDLERLALERSDQGRQTARENIRRGREFLVREAEPWMERHGNMGRDLQTTTTFLQEHTQFSKVIEERDAAIQFALGEAPRLSDEEQKAFRQFDQRYNTLKKNLDNRILLAKTFQQVETFSRELESSFESLEKLLDSQSDVRGPQGVTHMEQVVEMIEETLSQERQQADRFISSASSVRSEDSTLKTEEATEAVKEIVVRHDRQFSDLAQKWTHWQGRKADTTNAHRVLETVQNWLEETESGIRTWEETRAPQKDNVLKRIDEVKETMEHQKERVHAIATSPVAREETVARHIVDVKRKQEEIDERIRRIEQKIIEERQEEETIKRQTHSVEQEQFRTVQHVQPETANAHRVLETVQNWLEETDSAIRTWEQSRAPQRDNVLKQIDEVKETMEHQKERVENIATSPVAREEPVMLHIMDVKRKQEETDEQIRRVEQKITEEKRRSEEKRQEEETIERQIYTMERDEYRRAQPVQSVDQQIERMEEEEQRVFHHEEDQRQQEALRQKYVVEQRKIEEEQSFFFERQQHARREEERLWQEQQKIVQQQIEEEERMRREERRLREEEERKMREIVEQTKREEEESIQREIRWRQEQQAIQDERQRQIRREQQEQEKRMLEEQERRRVEEERRHIEMLQIEQERIQQERQREITRLAEEREKQRIHLEEMRRQREEEEKRQQEIWRVEKQRIHEEHQREIVRLQKEQEQRLETQKRQIEEEERRQREIFQVEQQRILSEQQQQVVQLQQQQAERLEEKRRELEEHDRRQRQLFQETQKKILEEQQKEMLRIQEERAARIEEEKRQIEEETKRQREIWITEQKRIHEEQKRELERLEKQKQERLQEQRRQIEEVERRQREIWEMQKQKMVEDRKAETERLQREQAEKIEQQKRELEEEEIRQRTIWEAQQKRIQEEQRKEMLRLQEEQRIRIEEERKRVEEEERREREIWQREQERIRVERQKEIERVRKEQAEKLETERRKIEEEERIQKEEWQRQQQKILDEQQREMIRLQEEEKRRLEGKKRQVEEEERQKWEMWQEEQRKLQEQRLQEIKKMHEEQEQRRREIEEEEIRRQEEIKRQTTQLERIQEEEEDIQSRYQLLHDYQKALQQQQRVTVEEILAQEDEENIIDQRPVQAAPLQRSTVHEMTRRDSFQAMVEEKEKSPQQHVAVIHAPQQPQAPQITVAAPKIVTELRDVQVEEGRRVEFTGRVQSKTEPAITWLKDGVSVSQSPDYRISFVNGTASLSIEETFIEDSATFTLRVENEAGRVESSARLVVLPVKKPADQGRPRMVRSLQNTSIEEGEKLVIDCVVVGQPEPTVTWFKEEETIREDDRRRLDFRGDHCSLTIEPAYSRDSGVYTAKAKNVHGEATSFCQARVIPRPRSQSRGPVPAPPPKPKTPVSWQYQQPQPQPQQPHIATRPPAIQPTLTNSTYRTGMKAVLQVFTTGVPKPAVEWSCNSQPIKQSTRVRLVEEETGWSRLIIESVQPEDAGMYMVVARNEVGEARTGATLHVQKDVSVPQVQPVQQEKTFRQEKEGEDVFQLEKTVNTTYQQIPSSTSRTTTSIETEKKKTSKLPGPQDISPPTTKKFSQVDETELTQKDVTEIEGSRIPKPVPPPRKAKVQSEEFLSQEDVEELAEVVGKPKSKQQQKDKVVEEASYAQKDAREIVVAPLALTTQRDVRTTEISEKELKQAEDKRDETPEEAVVDDAQQRQRQKEKEKRVEEDSYAQKDVREIALNGAAPQVTQEKTTSEVNVKERMAQQSQESMEATAAALKKRQHQLRTETEESLRMDGRHSGTTNAVSPPKQRRTQEEEFHQKETKEIGIPSVATIPSLIKHLHREYTVNEDEELTLECSLIGNPRPKTTWFFNEHIIQTHSKFAEVRSSGDSSTLTIPRATLDHSGYYKFVAENVRGSTESQTIIHVRPKALGTAPTKEHSKTTEEFAIFEYQQRRPTSDSSRIPVPMRHLHPEMKRESQLLEEYSIEEHRLSGQPPHFSQTLVSAVAADGQSAKFEGVVTGIPPPSVEWSKEGVVISPSTHPHLVLSDSAGRVSLSFPACRLSDAGKYKCTVSNASGVATSSAQLVVRPKTVAPDFVHRLMSEEVEEGRQLKWTVKVTGEPAPVITWLRDGVVVPHCEEVRLNDEGAGVHSLVIMRVELADSGQFTCLAENAAGEARSTADLVVRPQGSAPGHYFHVTKVTQEKQLAGERVGGRNESFTVQAPAV